MSSLTLPSTTAPDYHWTGANQRRFLETLAQQGVVSLAAKAVGMSGQAAYAFRQRGTGRVFALGWLAAVLVSRDRLVDDLMERAFCGQEEELVRDPDNNRLVRKRIDNRLGIGMLARLDRMIADATMNEPLLPAARIVAGDFEKFLDLVEREGSGAEAGVFLATHASGQTGGVPGAFHYQLPQISGGVAEDGEEEFDALPASDRCPQSLAVALSVWWDEDRQEWRTDFPPPNGFDGEEEGRYGDDDYQRALSADELAVQEARAEIESRPYRAAAQAARQSWFAADAEVKAEMQRRARAERAEQKARLAEARAEAKRRANAEKRAKREAERLAKAMAQVQPQPQPQPQPQLESEWTDDYESDAPVTGSLAAAEDTPASARQGPPTFRTITLPQQPPALFGIYGDRLPGPLW